MEWSQVIALMALINTAMMHMSQYIGQLAVNRKFLSPGCCTASPVLQLCAADRDDFHRRLQGPFTRTAQKAGSNLHTLCDHCNDQLSCLW